MQKSDTKSKTKQKSSGVLNNQRMFTKVNGESKINIRQLVNTKTGEKEN